MKINFPNINLENITKSQRIQLLSLLNKAKAGPSNSSKIKTSKKIEIMKSEKPKVKSKSNDWIPNLDDSSFLHIFNFVLLSIFECKEIGIHTDYYSSCLKQVSSTYHHLITHHGITGGTKKWKEQTQYVILLAEGRNPEALP